MAALHILKSWFVSRAMVALLLLELPGQLCVDITLLSSGAVRSHECRSAEFRAPECLLRPLPHLPDIHWVPPLPGIQVYLPSFPAMQAWVRGPVENRLQPRAQSVSSVVFFDEWEMETSRKSAFYLEQSGPVLGMSASPAVCSTRPTSSSW